MAAPSTEGFAIAPCLERLLARQDLDARTAREVMQAILEGRVAPAGLSAFLVALRAKGESEDELSAFAGVLRSQALRLQAPEGTLDTCGTGGDRSATFNISTATALVAAGMGLPVAKHGNRSVSSRSGSADVLQTLGVRVDAPVPVVERCLSEAGIGFLFAPVFHPGVKNAAPVRRELGIRTVFNLLGPLANPAGAKRQLLGVFEPRWCEPFARVLRSLGSESARVVCGTGPGGQGYLDEVSTWGPTTVACLEKGVVRVESFDAADLGFVPPPAQALAADGPEASARILRQILAGQPGSAREIVLANASAAAQAAGRAATWKEGVALAAEAIDGGRAQKALEGLIRITNETA